MQVNERTDKLLHASLPIEKDEKILAVYRHHWFAYASSWIIGFFIVVVVMVLTTLLTTIGTDASGLAQYRTIIIVGAAIFSAFVLLGTFIPVYLRSQEQVILTEEALLQVLQPGLFSSKIDQLNLQHIADVSVHQDFFGTILGYGHITIETPGEQDNYQFSMIPIPREVAQEILQAHENYDAAMQSGRISTTLGTPQPEAPTIDPQQYQQFLQYQQMVAQQQTAAQPQAQPTPEVENGSENPTSQTPQ
jgi:uncharacterized membrane protein YdbT with pleckstrin-like domain